MSAFEHEPQDGNAPAEQEMAWALTAWAIGEAEALSDTQRAAVEALLERDAEARQYVEEMQATGERLSHELAVQVSNTADAGDSTNEASGAKQSPQSEMVRDGVETPQASGRLTEEQRRAIVDEAQRVAGEGRTAGTHHNAQLSNAAQDLGAQGTRVRARSAAAAAGDSSSTQHSRRPFALGAREWSAMAAAAALVVMAGTWMKQRGMLAPADTAVATGSLASKEEGVVGSRRRLQSLGYFDATAPSPAQSSAPSEVAAEESFEALDGLGYAGGDRGDQAQRERRRVSSVQTARKERAPVADRPGRFDQNAHRLLDGDSADRAPVDREQYEHLPEADFTRPADEPLSTFSIDVDTASYANVRRFLRNGQRPPIDAVRIEELINYFPYSYPTPEAGAEVPFVIDLATCAAPWNAEHRLLRIGISTSAVDARERGPSNLVFLIDVSGSMNATDKLELLKRGLRLLVGELGPNDRISIVTYAGNSGLVLPATPGNAQATIVGALDRLTAGGSTNGGAGIELAYRVAQDNYIEEGTNRVILATDGDFNVGVSDDGSLTRLIEEKRASGVALTVLGFGTGNLQDAKMERLSGHGNGNYAYIDSLFEARKVLVEELGATLETVAQDVKIQVEFNPLEVASYRLIGYENRALAARDFEDDSKDAGEIGAGHRVTALYELVPADGIAAEGEVKPLRYQNQRNASGAAFSGELGEVRVRYKRPGTTTSQLVQEVVKDPGTSFLDADLDTRFAASVAAFGMLLRQSAHVRTEGTTGASIESVLEWASGAAGQDLRGYRAGFVEMLRRASELGY